MQLTQLISTLKTYEQSSYLYEGLTLEETKSVKLWEHAGILLKEAALTPDQIQQIFQNLEQSATSSGSNRTLLGKGKDAADAINKAWEDLKTKIQNSGPIQNVDSTYDSAVAKIEAGLGGPDNAVSKIIMKYRDFAKKHPVAQGFIYAALIAAAGISGAGLGGAAVLGLLKMADKLLQGEKFSSAAYAGAKTGATAYAAGQIGQALKGSPQGEVPQPASTTGAAVDAASKFGQTKNMALKMAQQAIDNGEVTDYNSMLRVTDQILADLPNQHGPQLMQGVEQMIRTKLMAGMGGMTNGVANNIARESKNLSESQIQQIFTTIDDTLVLEGFMDKVKQFGKNLTTKVTADKLNKAWKSAGSPTDSEEVAQVLKGAGVDPALIASTFTSMNLPAPAGKVEPTLEPQGQVAPASPVNTKELLDQILKLDKATQQELLTLLKA